MAISSSGSSQISNVALRRACASSRGSARQSLRSSAREHRGLGGPHRGRRGPASALAPAGGDVRSPRNERVGRSPLQGGLGGSSLVLGFGVPFPRARWAAGVSAGFRPVSAGFSAARARKVSDPDRPLRPKPRSRPDSSRAELSDPDRPLTWKPRSGPDCSQRRVSDRDRPCSPPAPGPAREVDRPRPPAAARPQAVHTRGARGVRDVARPRAGPARARRSCFRARRRR